MERWSRFRRLSKRPGPHAVLALALGSPLVALVHFVRTPIAKKLSYLPDDAFYYLQLAREWSRSGTWSFDGRSTTTGFHLVQAYYCVILQKLVPPGGGAALDRLLSFQALAGVLLALASLLMLRAAAERLFPRGSLFAMLTVGCAGAATILPLQAMESPFVMFCGAVAALAYATERPRLLAAALVVGPLCRADFVLVGLGLGLATLSLDRRPRRLAPIALATLAGGALVVLHTYVVDGHFFQTSARVKAHWGAVLGYQLSYGVEPVGYAFTPAGFLTLALNFGPALYLIPFALLVWGAWLGRRTKLDAPAAIALRWGAIATLLFILVYGRVSAAAQCWYGASFFMPLFLAMAGFAAALPERVRRWSTIAAIPLALVVLGDSHRPIWNADGRYEAIVAFADDAATVPLAAAWNAGALGYLGGERTVNIDGLVNDDVVPYILANRVPCYLLHESIPFVIDDPEWPTGRHAAFLGVSDPALMAALVPIPPLRSGLGGWRVDLAKLAAEPACQNDERSPRSRARRPWLQSR